MQAKMLVKTFLPGGVPDIGKALDEGTSVSVFNRQHGMPTTVKLVIVLLTDLNTSLNVARPMNEPQIMDLAMDFAAQMWWLKLEEIALFLEGLKKGYFQTSSRKIYERLDGAIIWDLLDVYLEARQKEIEARRAVHCFSDPILPNDVGTGKVTGKMDGLAGSLDQLKTALKTKLNLTDGK